MKSRLVVLWILAALALGVAEGGYHLLRPRPPAEFPGASGPHLFASAALHLVTLGLPALLGGLLAYRLRSRRASWLISFCALLPTLFVLCDHQVRWRIWPELIQWDPPAHYLRVSLLCLVATVLIATLAALVLDPLVRARRPSLPRLLLLLPLLALVSLPFLLPSPPVVIEASRSGADGLPNVLLVTLDTLRMDALGAYGGPPTPKLDALFDSGVRIEGWAPAPWTRPSFAALFSGLGSAANGSDAQRGVAPDIPWWPQRLQQAGYHTAAVICNPHLERRYGFRRGFDEFEHSGEIERLEPIAQSMWTRWLTRLLDEPSRRGDRLVGRAARWLRRAPDRPWFLWVHLLDPHLPYHLRGREGELDDENPGAWIEPLRPAMQGDLFRKIFETRRGEVATSAEARGALRELYQREVRFTDVQVGRLMEAAREAAKARDLLWIVTSDHGEEFFEHGGFEHGHSLYAELLRVPLGFGGAGLPGGGSHPGMRLQDVGPTLMGLLGLSAFAPDSSAVVQMLPAHLRAGVAGTDRSGELLDPSGECTPVALIADNPFYERELLRIHDAEGGWLLDDGQTWRLNPCLDPADRSPALLDSMPAAFLGDAARLAAWRDEVAERVEAMQADGAMRERLRSLGYVE